MARVVGRGLLAQAFTAAQLDESFLIFASGVSNSTETRESEFLREKELLLNELKSNSERIVIYFSTCSVYQQPKVAYAKHKLEMEELIARESKKYHIYRLPQVVGVVNNTTIISYFVKAALAGVRVQIKRDAKRYLIGIDDVARLVEKLSATKERESFTANLATSHAVDVLSIYKKVVELVNGSPAYDIVSGGDSYDIPIHCLQNELNADDAIFQPSYWADVLKLYVPKMVALIAGKESV